MTPEMAPDAACAERTGLAAIEPHTLQVLDSLGDMVLVKGPQSRILWANKSFRDFYGMTNAALQGLIDATFSPPDHTQRYVRDDGHVFETGLTLDIEEPVTRYDGQVFVFHTVKSPIRDEAGTVVMTVGVSRDITKLRQTESRLRIAERMASIGTLAAGVAHEVNNPLTYVQLNLAHCCETLAKPVVSAADIAAVRLALAEVVDGAERVRVIVRDLHTFAREDEAQDTRVDLRAVVDNARRMAANEIKHRARLVIDSGGEAAFVDGNEAQLGQVFLNLLVNAAQATPEGDAENNEIRVVTRVSRDGNVAIEVRDSGCGIAPENLTRLFDPFFTTKPVGEGTGLGLCIVHNLVSANHGTIEVESIVGEGSVFRVVFPASTLEHKPAPAPPVAPPTLGRPRILVVDDEPMVLTVLARVIGGTNEVVTSDCASSALKRIVDGERFDVILSDVSMPRMTGGRFFEEVRKVDLNQSGRFVFMTGGVFTAEAQAFLADSSHRRIDKPLKKQAVEQAIHAVMMESDRA